MSELKSKICRKCGVDTPLHMFTNDKHKADGKKHQCKVCEKLIVDRRKTNKNNLRRILNLKISRESKRLKPFKEIDKNLKRRAKIKNKAKELQDKFLNKSYGSYEVTEYVGYYKRYCKYPRHYFRRVCRFCGESTLKNETSLRTSFNKEVPEKCCRCRESVNIHTKEKKCGSCENWKPIDRFTKSSNKFMGIGSYCKICHREKCIDRRKNPEVRHKEYLQKKERKKYDHLFKFKNNLRVNIKNSFLKGGWRKTTKTFEILGCTYEEFLEHISSKFTDGMTLSNHGEWHLDHQIPMSMAKNQEEAIELCHFTNYQPLWKTDNISKGDKLFIRNIPKQNKVRYKKFIDRYKEQSK